MKFFKTYSKFSRLKKRAIVPTSFQNLEKKIFLGCLTTYVSIFQASTRKFYNHHIVYKNIYI